MTMPVYILGGHQTDFAKHAARENKTIFELMKDTVDGALEATHMDPRDVQVAHIGNFNAELFCKQGQLGGLFASQRPEFHGIPTMRQEAACASGAASILSAMADLQSGRYDVACVLGVELMRNVPGEEAAANVGTAAWYGREAEGAKYIWPFLFSRFVDVYRERFGIDRAHLAEISRINFDNARKNPNAQTRKWVLSDAHFAADDEKNPVVEGNLRRHDCSQITDGGAALFLATPEYAQEYARKHGLKLENIPSIRGWGHRTAPMGMDEKLEAAKRANSPWVMHHMRATFEDAWRRAGISGAGIEAVDAVEVHDCFSITEYMTIEHLGIAPIGKAFQAIESGRIKLGGKTPVNPSGGLTGVGHPIGATGVRQVLDAFRQTTGTAGDNQVEGARTVQTVNMGGSGTTVISFVVGV